MLLTMNYKQYLDQIYDNTTANPGVCMAIQSCHEQVRALYHYQMTRFVVRALIEDIQSIVGNNNSLKFVSIEGVDSESDNFFYPDLEESMIASGIQLPEDSGVVQSAGGRISRGSLLNWLLENGRTGKTIEIDLDSHPGNFFD